MKKAKHTFFIALFSVGISFSQTTITNTPSIKYQTMKGWGVSLAWWGNLVGGMPQASIDDITNRVAIQANLNFFRFNIGAGENPNCPWGNHMRKDGAEMPGYRSIYPNGQGWGVVDVSNDYRQIAVMNKLASLRAPYGDIITEMFSTSPPYFMTRSSCAAGGVNGGENLKPGYEDDFADYLCSVTKTLRTAHPNWNIKYLEPFNEPYSDWWKAGASQEGCKILQNNQATVLWRLWQRQQVYGIEDIGLVASDCNTVQEARTNAYELWANHFNEYKGLSAIATHTYAGSWQNKADLYTEVSRTNKPVWQTETGPADWSPPAGGEDWWWRHYDMAYRMIEDIRNLQSEVWCDWQAMSYDDGWALVQQTNWDPNNPYQAATLKNTRSLYIYQQITNYAKVGYTQIGNNNGNSMTFLKPNNKEVVVVLVNNSTSSKSYLIDLTEFQNISSFNTYRTSGDDNSCENATELTTPTQTNKGKLEANKIAYTAPAWSVTTFVVKTPGLVNTAKASLTSNLESELKEDNISNNVFSVYPNPTSDIISINLTSAENTKVRIFNLNGQQLYESPLLTNKQLVINVKEMLSSGVYIIKATGKNGSQTQKLIVK
ncbi:T9SS type A sorting domain-containing protein [Flavobacterium pectinovorum]|uniref:Por secretion system C-terminal sorting domain-containing protein n=1 Tax=Flavobacterium pectinovorum TaxID=29533 RepID=A0AB36NU29_9FLAO|nr:T9SS type A sorting domain-containing protein [Flavobacterium pectinovorum]OXA98649.1 hypothetical protein B0A72_23300 [Flavobacterium pectinovorum]SHL26664.1 Por secretion system C-terminal sorting domain-containing protein [Flavobacterium pectinovorum]